MHVFGHRAQRNSQLATLVRQLVSRTTDTHLALPEHRYLLRDRNRHELTRTRPAKTPCAQRQRYNAGRSEARTVYRSLPCASCQDTMRAMGGCCTAVSSRGSHPSPGGGARCTSAVPPLAPQCATPCARAARTTVGTPAAQAVPAVLCVAQCVLPCGRPQGVTARDLASQAKQHRIVTPN